MVLVGLYLAAIVVANISVALFGPSVVIVNALVLIGLDITARDALHEQWHGRYLWPKMAALIIAGSLLSWLLNRNAGPIALASCIAFALSSLADTAVYAALGRWSWFTRVNGSNIVSAAVDSVVFVSLVFGVWLPWIVLGQWLAKVVGGACWAYVLRRRRAGLVPA
jgi:hypothetical protein